MTNPIRINPIYKANLRGDLVKNSLKNQEEIEKKQNKDTKDGPFKKMLDTEFERQTKTESYIVNYPL